MSLGPGLATVTAPIRFRCLALPLTAVAVFFVVAGLVPTMLRTEEATSRTGTRTTRGAVTITSPSSLGRASARANTRTRTRARARGRTRAKRCPLGRRSPSTKNTTRPSITKDTLGSSSNVLEGPSGLTMAEQRVAKGLDKHSLGRLPGVTNQQVIAEPSVEVQRQGQRDVFSPDQLHVVVCGVHDFFESPKKLFHRAKRFLAREGASTLCLQLEFWDVSLVPLGYEHFNSGTQRVGALAWMIVDLHMVEALENSRDRR
ncbi:hypothetical protein EDC96DRAFT_538627 [Choanephora cucurbitarum]|nr:hypothetical protein EDC96DRAFT_538627 [Choanephora cucurbitarum]